MKCEACEEGRHSDCTEQSSCDCDCDPTTASIDEVVALMAPDPPLIEDTDNQHFIWHAILAERRRQDEKWGADRQQSHELWLTIMTEELGELAEAILKGESKNIWKELIHVLAVGVAYAEDAGFRMDDIVPVIQP